MFGSPGRARTADLVINSHPLYRLSYRGILRAVILLGVGARVNSRGLFLDRHRDSIQSLFQVLHAGGKGEADMSGQAEG